ncbi:hypothetical protein NDU88_004671 [Pleurodeles waltl]|uniref:Uncharacterized protein n=1 Tax=Pleurodeles waltl TaxID=8319 RepID=A0AAV7RJV3_PLEWA|nr:hypothetical protein NDU88_004671 [Pleurodeles waltl]
MSGAASWSDTALARLKLRHALLPGAAVAAFPSLSASHQASRSHEAAARRVVTGCSATRASNRGARLATCPIDGTPSSGDLQRLSGARSGVPGARTTPLPLARGPPIHGASVLGGHLD